VFVTASGERWVAMSQASGMVGWEYAVWDRLDPVMAANHRCLGGL
jgi:hypothetical protein